MDAQRPSTSGAFNGLPIEINREIVSYLDTDKEIADFRLVCKGTNDAVDGDFLSFWRFKFRQFFALKAGTKNRVLKQQYQRRKKYMRLGAGINWYHGWSKPETRVLQVLAEIINESFQGGHEHDDYGRPRCLNQDQLLQFIQNSKNFLAVKRPRAPKAHGKNECINPALAAVQIMCAHFLFENLNMKHNIYCFEVSQKAVYQTPAKAPMFVGLNKVEVNMELVLHGLNFFRNHMVGTDMGMHHMMRYMHPTQKPSPWQTPLSEGCSPLTKHWKGTYAFLDHADLRKVRAVDEDDDDLEVFIDGNVDIDGKIQLECGEPGAFPWSQLFEKHLKSSPPPAQAPRTRAQGRSLIPNDEKPTAIQFRGEGDDAEDHFYATGWLTSLPPQPAGLDIPGWQRITFMKSFDTDEVEAITDNLWAYEGVVLPGGRIIIGRWWLDYSGPFIFWAVEPELGFEGNITETSTSIL
ncbi:hypothetical protein BCR34DRAFT_489227 [Clohesyomyces aquaticus]|uniref:F-box domain-containing protein n=1 Tax=Clohesyomyces aquaticus TaxID=1231657 RepID=A0A1Y1ZBY0_9PLEO|nr:hypothetical protein BCR34DRAFT_489227 [Clohesyomyces aquaticus]